MVGTRIHVLFARRNSIFCVLQLRKERKQIFKIFNIFCPLIQFPFFIYNFELKIKRINIESNS